MSAKFLILQSADSIKPFYTWKPYWIAPYESPWGIFEKFKYANNAITQDLLSLIGSDTLLNRLPKKISLSLKNCELFEMAQLCDERIIELLGHPIKLLNKDYIDLIFKKYPGNDYFREELTYCKRCLKKGYHSILHQFKLVHCCPFHKNTKLNNRCPKCKITIPYRLNDECSGFRCKCGHTFFNDIAHFHVIWKKYQPKIVSPVIERWITLNDQNQKGLERIILFSEINPEKVPNMMERLLSMIDLGHECQVKDRHYIIKSHSNLYKQGGRLQHYMKAYDARDERALDRIEREVNEEIYDSSVNTFTAICSKLLKTILKKHRSCIERIDIDKEICPYAYAYLHWRHCVEGLGEHKRVYSRFFRKKPTYLYYQLDTISVQDQYVVHRLISNWEDKKNRNRKYESVAATKWVINRVIHFLIMNHFNNWLEFAGKRKYIQNGKAYFYHRQPFKYENLPMFAIKTPEKEDNDIIEFHWWQNDTDNKIDYDCPFNSVKKRRNNNRN